MEFINTTDPAESTLETIDLGPKPEINQVSPSVARNRASKYNYGLQENSPGPEQLEASVLNGTEGWERQQALIRKTSEDRRVRMDMINEITKGRGGTVQPEEYELLQSLSAGGLADALESPDTFFEKAFAKATTGKTLQGQSFAEAEKESPGLSHAILDAQERVLAQKEIVQKITENGEADFQRKSPLAKGLAYAETFVPFWTWSSVHEALPSDTPRSGILPGTLAEDSYTYLLGIPDLEQFRTETQATFDKLFEDSPTDALVWLQGLTSFSTSDKYLFNSVGLADLSVIPVGKLASMAGKGLATVSLAQAARDTVKVAGTRTYRPAAMKIVQGDAEGAALDITTSKMLEKANVGSHGDFEDLMGELNPLFNPAMALGQDTVSLTAEQVQRLKTGLETQSAGLLQTLSDPLLINRITGDRLKAAISETRKNWNAQYSELADTVIGIQPINAQDTLPGVDMLGVHIGTKDGTYFKSIAAANRMAKWYGLKDEFKIRQYGDSQFYIEVQKPIDETADAVRDIPLETAYETPKNLINMFTGFLRSPEDTISPRLMEDYKVAAYGSSAFTRQVQEVAQSIGSLKNSSKELLNSYLQKNRVFHDPKTGRIGRFASDQVNFETEWLDHAGRLPSEKETLAYWSYRQLNDYGFGTYNLSLLRDKQRLGLETFSFPWIDPAWAKPGVDNPVTATQVMQRYNRPPAMTQGLEGKFIRGGVDGIPWTNKEDAGILILDRDTTRIRGVRKNFTSPERLKEDLGDGDWQLIHLSPEGQRLMREEPGFRKTIPDGNFQYVLSREYQTKPLQWTQIPYRPGGIIEFPDGWFVRQPSVKPVERNGVTDHHYYNGDVNVFNFRTEKEAKAAAEAMDTARKMLAGGKAEDPFFGMSFLKNNVDSFVGNSTERNLEVFLQQNLPFKLNEFYDLFHGESALLDLHTPITFTPKDKSVEAYRKISDQYVNMIDPRRSSHNLYNRGVNLARAMERNDPIFTFQKTGDTELPAFNLRQADMLDPLSTINRSSAQLMKGRYLEDLKFKVSENFIAEFASALKTPIEELRLNPVKHLLDPEWRTGVDRATLAAAKNYRRAAVNFLGLKNDFQKNTRWMKQKLADFVFKTTGEKGFKIVEPYLLHRTKDPVTFFRSVAFHSYLGMFNPVQLFLQAQTVAHVAAVEGLQRGYQGLSAATLMRSLVLSDGSPSMVKAAANRAKAFGWTVPEFEESLQGLKRSGFWNVGAEHAARDDLLDPNVIQSAVGQFADKGTIFFREGERLSRLTAWNAAYKRWRTANKTAPFDDQAIKEVLGRADLLNVNMSSASLASWNKGFASIPTQFFNYQARLTEQFLGKRLTVAEKSRALLTYSALYGLPVGIGIPFLGLNPFSGSPMNTDIRQWLMEKGIDYDENIGGKTLMDGIASMSFEYATGTKWNIGSRYGPNGNTLFRDIISGEKTAVEMLLGAGGTSLGNFLSSAEPIAYSFAQVLSGDTDYINVGATEITNFARNISTVNNVAKAYYAIGLGEYITKNEVKVDDVAGWEGVTMALTGLTPQRIEDTFTMLKSNKDRTAAQNEARKEITKYYRKALRALKEGDDKEAAGYLKQVHLWTQAGQFRPDQKAGLLTDAMDGQTMALGVAQSFAKGDPARMQLFIQMLKRKEGIE